MFIKILFLLIFFAVMIGVGIYSRQHARSVDGFVLGGRSVGPWLTAFAYGTSYFSAVVFVGYAGQFGWKYGMATTWIGIGNALLGSLLAWVVLGRRTRVMSQGLHAATMPQFFGKRFDSNTLKIVSSAIVFIFLVPYTASIYNGLSRLFGMAFDIPYEVCVIVMAVFTGIYVVMGGYMATAINDFFQGIIMLVGIVAVIAAVLSGQGGFMEAVKSLAMIESDVPATLGQPGAFTSFFGTDPANLLGVVILTSLGTWGLPQMVQKFYAIKNEKAINTGTVISTMFAIVVAGGCYFLGGFGRLFDNPSLYNESGIVYDSIIPYMMSTLPDILIGIVVVLVLSASMSTLSSLVLTSSSTLALDFLYGNLIKKVSEKKQIITMQILIVFFIIVSVVIALRPSVFIAQLMGISWGALAGAFLAPFLYGLYWKKVTRAAVWASFITGVGITVSNMFLKYISSPINAGAIAMVVGLLVVPVVSLVTPKMNKAKVDEMFTCYDEEVVIKKKRSLEEM
ncbi:sodium:solute symporter family transporter [Diplocloster agilis]|uniref:Sodium:solute symporter n=1 Tax=Diplocloster agilis TaxID=2850323 RepID=A0A949JW58_9FIRM|nr:MULTISPECIES: sodium:solute symporter [Lachnospiraceae]MBU9735204.1 sodium:solute symporter [Diplocloster agilis]MBU9743602.1 sodium:solute symporter [Diplocloster agilis]MCU6733830.1 sodium:solute symporter [Suonthocola fibrivorans]SCJ10427.1 Proline permease [uncultured Clostridium sp.]